MFVDISKTTNMLFIHERYVLIIKTIEMKYIVPGTSMLRKTEILNMILDIRLLSTRLRFMKKCCGELFSCIKRFFFDQVLFGRKDN